MKLKELPVNAVIESLSEEDKKIYLPGILFSGIVDTEMELAQVDNPNERDECKNLIDELYLCGSTMVLTHLTCNSLLHSRCLLLSKQKAFNPIL